MLMAHIAGASILIFGIFSGFAAIEADSGEVGFWQAFGHVTVFFACVTIVLGIVYGAVWLLMR